MLTKVQKIIMYLSGALSIVLGIFTFIPFRAVPFFAAEESTIITEVILKSIIFPLLVIGLSVYPNLLKYQEVYDCRERSKVINVMSYFPALSYICAILVYLFHTLLYSSELLQQGVWAMTVVIVIAYFVFMLIAAHFAHHILMRLTKLGTILADALVGFMIVCFAIATWRLSMHYFNGSNPAYYFRADPYLFVILILAVFALIYAIKSLIKLVVVDECSVYISAADATDHLNDITEAEYNRAYNNILDDFEGFFADLTYEEAEEETEEEAPAEETEEEAPAEETKEEAPAEEAKEETPAEEAKEEAPAEEAKEEAPAEEAKEEAPAEETKEEAPVQETKPAPVKEPKVLTPSFEEVLEMAKAVEGGTHTPNPAGTVHKFTYEKKLFLIIQKTSNDYRVAFLADESNILKYIVKYPRVVIKPSSPKGDNWLLLVNKGNFDAEVLTEIVNGSLVTLKRLMAEAAAQKEAEKAAKKAEKEAQKKAEKEAAKKAKANK